MPRSNLNLARVNACDMFSKLCILFVVCIRVSVFDNILRTEMLSRSDQAVVDCIIFSQGHLVCRPNVSVIICTLICIVSCLSNVWDSYLIHWLYRLNCKGTGFIWFQNSDIVVYSSLKNVDFSIKLKHKEHYRYF